LVIAAQQRKSLKIVALETDLTIHPPRKPTYDALQTLGVNSGTVTLRLRTDAGITGWAQSNFGAIEGGPQALRALLEHEVKPLILDQDPALPKAIRARLQRGLQYQGLTGLTNFALAASDIAVWDILGKHAGMPVWRMLGAARDRMPVYSMCGWYYDNDNDLSQYKAQIETALSQGYQAIKIKTGKYSLADDERRIRLAVDLAGQGRRVMLDANQVFNRNEALRRGADIVQPDNRRAGGVTEWLEIAAIADAAGLDLASHGGGDVNMNMLCAIPNAIYMESSGPQPRMIDGEVTAPETPGMSTEPKGK